jgi:nucleoside-diphosphate-sugar epimerase
VKVVITGGGGFLGQRLARRLLERGRLVGSSGRDEEIERVVLFDTVAAKTLDDPRVDVVAGEIADRDEVFRLLDVPGASVFHLASVVSSGAERDFDLALRVNLHGGLHVLEACRAAGTARLVTTSSYACYGGDLPEIVDDRTPLRPTTTYGMTKVMLELLVNDYSRKGYVDGRTARLPTVVVRPGKPNLAASSWVSGVFREPLGGVDFVLPVGLAMATPVAGVRTVVESLMHLHDLDAGLLGADRAVLVPSVAVTAGDMVACVRRTGEGRQIGAIDVRPDAYLEAICGSWPKRVAAGRAEELGFPRDESLDAIAREYVEDYLT